MPLCNRVDPNGNFFNTTARGAWMGNRGQLHGTAKVILRPFKLKAWITCLLDFKNRHRALMAPNQYTELFFMDEATAFAAGHRPCFECRRRDYQHFKMCWLAGNPQYGFNKKTSIKKIDEIIHKERIDADGGKVTFKDTFNKLPNGVMIELNGKPYLLWMGRIFHWTAFGYGTGKNLDGLDTVTILTPRSVVNAIRQGYEPQAKF